MFQFSSRFAFLSNFLSFKLDTKNKQVIHNTYTCCSSQQHSDAE